jgi:hypothetical protein
MHRQIIAIQDEAPAPLSRFAEGVPERLEEIVAKALAKDPNERYQTAKDFLIDLRNLKRKLEVDAEIDRTLAPEARAGAATAGSQSVPPTASQAETTVTQPCPAHKSFWRSGARVARRSCWRRSSWHSPVSPTSS